MPHFFDLRNDIFHCEVVGFHGCVQSPCLKHQEVHLDSPFEFAEVSGRYLGNHLVDAVYPSLPGRCHCCHGSSFFLFMPQRYLTLSNILQCKAKIIPNAGARQSMIVNCFQITCSFETIEEYNCSPALVFNHAQLGLVEAHGSNSN